MKVLLDENLPHQLRHELPGHDVFSVAYMGWSGTENGKLLNEAAHAGFDVLITNDRGLEYDQNLATLPVAVVVLLATTNTMESLRPLLIELLDALGQLKPGEFRKVPSN